MSNEQLGRFVWHTLTTSDVERASSFYEQLLGWSTEVWKPGGMDVTVASADGVGIADYQKAPDGVPSHWLGHVQVESADEALERATAAGATVLAGPMDMSEVGRFVVLEDPQGGVASAYTPETETPPSAGAFVWDELLAPDVDAAKRFYSDVFGWTTSEMDVGMGVYTLFQAASEPSSAGLMQKPDEMPGGAAWIPYAYADDVDATVANAGELGATVLLEGMDVPTIGRVAMLMDPTGAVVGLFKPLES